MVEAAQATTPREELKAMGRCATILEGLDHESSQRVLSWLVRRFSDVVSVQGELLSTEEP